MGKKVMFINKVTGRELGSVSLDHTSQEEIDSIKSLYAYENKVDKKDIEAKIK